MGRISTNFFDIVRNHQNFNQKNSVDWFLRNVRQLGTAMNVGPMRILGDNLANQSSAIAPGQMIMYTYDPKYKKTLPFYDTFPLVLPFAADETHFTGINFHYLYPRTRALLLNKLMEFVNDDRLTPNAKIQVSWNLLKNAGKFPEIQPAVKQYLFSHVKSRFLIVPPQDWMSAVFIPCERFHKASNQQVWGNSATRK